MDDLIMLRASVLAALFIAAVASAEEPKVLLVSSAFADPSLVAPGMRLEVERGDGISYAMGISGWTVDGEWAKALTPSRALRFTADATPIHAHNSNLMYVDLKRSEELDYDNSSYRIRAGMRFTPSPRTTTDVMVVGLYESVGNLPASTEARWDSPYAGVEVAHTFSIMNSREPLVASFDGLQIITRGEFMIGERNFSRITLIEQAGRNLGRFHVRQSVTLLNGSSLDVVNRFQVGGSWDALGGTAVYGLRYGQLRIDRAIIASGGADVRVGGNWRVGIRGSYVKGDDDATYGHAVNASTTWKTVGANFGVGFSERSETTVYAALIVPLYRR